MQLAIIYNGGRTTSASPYSDTAPTSCSGNRYNKTNNHKNKNIMAKVIEGLYYSESHEFVKVAGNIGYIGITDYAQNALGNIVYVDMLEIDEDFGAIESVKAASDLKSPVSGKVIEVNEALEDEPDLLNKDAFENWIIKVELSDTAELKDLMDAKAYEEFCAE